MEVRYQKNPFFKEIIIRPIEYIFGKSNTSISCRKFSQSYLSSRQAWTVLFTITQITKFAYSSGSEVLKYCSRNCFLHNSDHFRPPWLWSLKKYDHLETTVTRFYKCNTCEQHRILQLFRTVCHIIKYQRICIRKRFGYFSKGVCISTGLRYNYQLPLIAHRGADLVMFPNVGSKFYHHILFGKQRANVRCCGSFARVFY